MHICKKLAAIFLSLLFPLLLSAQDTTRAKKGKIFQPYPLIVSAFSNASALPTSPGQIFEKIHPGIMVGTAFRYNKNQTHQLSQTVKLGFFHHRFVQSAVQLYSEFAYRYELKNGLGFDAMAGAGYVHSIPHTEILVLNNDGVYEKKTNLGKPEFMGSTAIGLGYTFKKNQFLRKKTHPIYLAHPIRIFANYQFWLQAPFIKQYVPVLPNTALHIGLAYQLNNDIKRPRKWKSPHSGGGNDF